MTGLGNQEKEFKGAEVAQTILIAAVKNLEDINLNLKEMIKMKLKEIRKQTLIDYFFKSEKNKNAKK